MTIRARLTLIYAAAMLATLSLAGSVVWWQLRAALRSSLDDALLARAAAVLTTLENQGQGGIQESNTTTPTGIFVVVFDAGGLVVDSTAGTPAGLSAPPIGAQSLDVTIGSTAYALRIATSGDAAVRVVAGSSLVGISATMDQIARWLLLVGGLGALASLAGGWWLAGRALRPVAMLTTEAEHIGVDDVDRRLPIPAQRDELQALAITLNRMLERVSSTLGRQQAFIAAASHDLRTPIAALQAELDLADDDRSTLEEMREAVRSAHAEAARLGELATALLDLAGADAQGRALVRTRVDADELLASVVRRTAPLARKREIVVTSSGPSQLVRVDRIRIEQALTNLVANAIAYSPIGSTVEIIAEIQPLAGPGASAGPGGAEGRTELTIDVLDRGPGIPAGDADAVFLPFHRGTAAAGIGAGLGLATAAAAIQAHHGSIGFAPRDGGGTRFWVRVPA